MPYLFTSLKVASRSRSSAAIVGELPTRSRRAWRTPARRVYYGQTVQIWAALFMAAALAAVLVMIVGLAHTAVLKRMGAKP